MRIASDIPNMHEKEVTVMANGAEGKDDVVGDFREKLKEIGMVLLFGALGGILCWIYSLSVGETLPFKTMHPLWAIISSISLGAGAGGIGIYVIFNSDSRDIRRFLFIALLCGFSWNPVYEAGGALINQKANQNLEKQVKDNAVALNTLTQELPGTPESQLPEKMNQITQSAIGLLNELPKVGDRKLEAEARDSVQNAVAVIEKSAQSRPEEGSKALQQIGNAASINDQFDITQKTIDSLSDIGQKTDDSKVAISVFLALDDIARAARDEKNVNMATDSQYRGAMTIFSLAKKAVKNEDKNTLTKLPLDRTLQDLGAIKKFYYAENEPEKVEVINQQIIKLNGLINTRKSLYDKSR